MGTHKTSYCMYVCMCMCLRKTERDRERERERECDEMNIDVKGNRLHRKEEK